MMDDTQRIRAHLLGADCFPDGYAEITACARDDERFRFRTNVPTSLLPKLNNGIVFTIRGGSILHVEPDEAAQ